MKVEILKQTVNMAKKDVEQNERDKALQDLKAKMEKDFGKGILIGAREKPMEHDFVSTGSVRLNKALGIGGVPRGRISEIYGPESSGKTTMCLELIKEAQMADKTTQCAFIDVEHALDLMYAEQLGVDLDRLQISQPDYGEAALEIVKRLTESKQFAVIVVDSVAALVPKDELEGEIGKVGMARQARLMSQAMRMLVAAVDKSNTLLIFTNQLRDKPGVMFGPTETTTGGNALKFYSSIRMDIRRIQQVKSGDEAVANRVKVKVVKNKLSPPFRVAEFEIRFGEGIDDLGEVLDIACEMDIIKKSGSWFSYDGNNIGQGQESVREMLKGNPQLFNTIKQKVSDIFVPENFVPTEEEANG